MSRELKEREPFKRARAPPRRRSSSARERSRRRVSRRPRSASASSRRAALPSVWDSKAATTEKIAAEVKQFLGGKGIVARAATVPLVQVHQGVEGASRVGVA